MTNFSPDNIFKQIGSKLLFLKETDKGEKPAQKPPSGDGPEYDGRGSLGHGSGGTSNEGEGDGGKEDLKDK